MTGPDMYTSTGHGAATGGRGSVAERGSETATGGRPVGRSVAGAVAAGWPRHWPSPEYPDPATIAATRAWLTREIEAGHGAASAEVPQFGTAAWVALPDSEPAKWIAVFRAARAWFADYVAIPETTARQVAEERERWEAILSDRLRAANEPFRRFCLETAAMADRSERRERQAAGAVLSNRTGPELIAAARASWAWLDGEATPDDSAGSGGVSADSAEVA
jgi:hypothetical protein